MEVHILNPFRTSAGGIHWSRSGTSTAYIEKKAIFHISHLFSLLNYRDLKNVSVKYIKICNAVPVRLCMFSQHVHHE
jgi:hypothetical protein